MTCPQELKQIVIDDLKDITFMEVCKLYVRTSKTGRTWDCKGKCASKQCSCKKMRDFCSTKCHSKRDCCTNMDEQTKVLWLLIIKCLEKRILLNKK